MKKNRIIPIIIAIFNTILCTLLLIFCIPNVVPLLAGINDEVILLGSKWWLLLGIVFPIILMILLLKTKNNYSRLIFAELIIFITYANMLGYAFFIDASNFSLGMRSEVPLSVVVFIPISLACFVYGAMLKHLPYKSKIGLRSKRTQTTEFIWIQSHLSASYYYRLTGTILFITAIIFTFLHLPLIELIVFVIALIIPRIMVEFVAKKMANKYQDMKAKHEHLQNKKANPN